MHNGREIARAGLLEITPASTIGEAAGEIDEGDGVISYQFETLMEGYPGWKWTVSIAQVEDSEPTVLETELIPAEGALLAPDWVPWSDRMDEYRAAQIALGEVVEDDESDDDSDDDDESNDELDDELDDSDDDESDDDDDSDEDVRPVLHAGDLDGVDIDEIDVNALHGAADSDDESDGSDDDDDDADADDADDDFADEDAASQAGALGNPAEQIFEVVEFDLVEEAPESEAPAPEASDAIVDVAGEEVDVPAVAPVTKRRSRRATSASVLPPAE
ncbi:DUF3027 domain-containing protein [Glaciihabitans sp. dw_435]|uniref:DUF3027 domain-containing protein n=1 Tax=Glaciihabitans sp. dw_435 TaxID=2720081 RepID=UPI001BD24C7E|nr:DUF3027 domain-containing protein [Glaciihabitans sp. dw_435]